MHEAQDWLGGLHPILLDEHLEFLEGVWPDLCDDPLDTSSIRVLHRLLFFYDGLCSARREVDQQRKSPGGYSYDEQRDVDTRGVPAAANHERQARLAVEDRADSVDAEETHGTGGSGSFLRQASDQRPVDVPNWAALKILDRYGDGCKCTEPSCYCTSSMAQEEADIARDRILLSYECQNAGCGEAFDLVEDQQNIIRILAEVEDDNAS